MKARDGDYLPPLASGFTEAYCGRATDWIQLPERFHRKGLLHAPQERDWTKKEERDD